MSKLQIFNYKTNFFKKRCNYLQKTAVCISCSNHYNERTIFIESYLLSQGYKCTYITSDFNHYTKEFYKVDKPDTIQIPTKPYKKNLSFSRLYSHIKFAKDAIKKVEELNPDILYGNPPKQFKPTGSKI